MSSKILKAVPIDSSGQRLDGSRNFSRPQGKSIADWVRRATWPNRTSYVRIYYPVGLTPEGLERWIFLFQVEDLYEREEL